MLTVRRVATGAHVPVARVLCCMIAIFNLISNCDKNGGEGKEVRHH